MLLTAEDDTAFRKIISQAILCRGRTIFQLLVRSSLLQYGVFQYHLRIKPFLGLILSSLTSLKPAYETLGSLLSTDLRPGKKYRLAAIVSAFLRGNSVNFFNFFFFNSYSFFLVTLLPLESLAVPERL